MISEISRNVFDKIDTRNRLQRLRNFWNCTHQAQPICCGDTTTHNLNPRSSLLKLSTTTSLHLLIIKKIINFLADKIHHSCEMLEKLMQIARTVESQMYARINIKQSSPQSSIFCIAIASEPEFEKIMKQTTQSKSQQWSSWHCRRMKLKIWQKREAIWNSRILDAIYKQKNIAWEEAEYLHWVNVHLQKDWCRITYLLGSVMVRILVSPK